MRIEHAVVVAARGGHYNEDLQAIRAGAERDVCLYRGKPEAPTFTSIRQPSEAFSLILRLSGGATVAGDGMSVAYSAAGGRRGLFRTDPEQLPCLRALCAHLQGRTISDLGSMCADLEAVRFDERLHRSAELEGRADRHVRSAARGVGGATAARLDHR